MFLTEMVECALGSKILEKQLHHFEGFDYSMLMIIWLGGDPWRIPMDYVYVNLDITTNTLESAMLS